MYLLSFVESFVTMLRFAAGVRSLCATRRFLKNILGDCSDCTNCLFHDCEMECVFRCSAIETDVAAIAKFSKIPLHERPEEMIGDCVDGALVVRGMEMMKNIWNQSGWYNELKIVTHTILCFSSSVEKTMLELEAGKLPQVSAHRWLEVTNFVGVWVDVALDESSQHADVLVIVLLIGDLTCERAQISGCWS